MMSLLSVFLHLFPELEGFTDLFPNIRETVDLF